MKNCGCSILTHATTRSFESFARSWELTELIFHRSDTLAFAPILHSHSVTHSWRLENLEERDATRRVYYENWRLSRLYLSCSYYTHTIQYTDTRTLVRSRSRNRSRRHKEDENSSDLPPHSVFVNFPGC